MNNLFKCLECGKRFEKAQGLIRHVGSVHKLSSKDYYDKYIKTEGEGICSNCGKPTKYISVRKGYVKYCGNKCSHSSEEFRKGVSQQFKGKKIPQEEIDKRAKAYKEKVVRTPEWNHKISEGQKGRVCSKETRRKMRFAKLGKPHKPDSEEARINKSRARVKVIQEGRGLNNWVHGKKGYFYSLVKNQGFIYFESSLEEKALNLLEFLSGFQTFSRCPFSIPYQWNNGSWHHYIPDFFAGSIRGISAVIEVKPKVMFKQDHNPEKFAAARPFCAERGFRFEVWTEDILKPVPKVLPTINKKEIQNGYFINGRI